MKLFFQKIIYLLLTATMLVSSMGAQQKKAGDNAKKKEKIERSYKKVYAKARKRTIKHRREIQSEATRDRMDNADKRAEIYNKRNDPVFLERILKKKRPKKR